MNRPKILYKIQIIKQMTSSAKKFGNNKYAETKESGLETKFTDSAPFLPVLGGGRSAPTYVSLPFDENQSLDKTQRIQKIDRNFSSRTARKKFGTNNLVESRPLEKFDLRGTPPNPDNSFE